MCEQTSSRNALMSFRASNSTKSTTRPHMPCAQCGESLFMPEWSEHVDERRVRHLWECDACGYAFEAVVFYETVAA
jgi:ribosomal protein S27AE